ncbi:MAG: EI24 domain-containing protein [Rubricella sp.]
MIFGALSRALGQLPDPALRALLLKSLGLTIAVFAGVIVTMGYLIALIGPVTVPVVGFTVDPGAGAGILTGLALLPLSFILMIPVATIVIGFFLDDIADAVEDVHYSHLPRANRLSMSDALVDALRFTGVVIGANIVALFLYILFLPLAPIIFWAMNGYLLGREYFQLVAARRMPLKEAAALRKRHMPLIWGAGVLIAMPLAIPIAGLIVPLVGVAMFTHIFHGLSGR